MMINFLLKRVYRFLFLMMSIFGFAQSVPPPPENPESGDIGAYPASPIDSYTFILFLIAIAMTIIFVMKQKQKALQ